MTAEMRAHCSAQNLAETMAETMALRRVHYLAQNSAETTARTMAEMMAPMKVLMLDWSRMMDSKTVEMMVDLI